MSNVRISELREEHLLRKAIISLHLVANRAATAQPPSARDRVETLKLIKQIKAGLAADEDLRAMLDEATTHSLNDFTQLHTLLWWVAAQLLDQSAGKFSPAEIALLCTFAEPDEVDIFDNLTRRLAAFLQNTDPQDEDMTNPEWFRAFLPISGEALKQVSLKRQRPIERGPLESW